MKVTIISYDRLPENEQDEQPDNGCGKEYATYLKVEIAGQPTIYYSDAMEPADARFYRALHWVKPALLAAYQAGRDCGCRLEHTSNELAVACCASEENKQDDYK